jgi:DNA uptake protein ComE-like DNA-binding protein
MAKKAKIRSRTRNLMTNMFYFSPSERRGIALLCGIMIILIIISFIINKLPYFNRPINIGNDPEIGAFLEIQQKRMDSMQQVRNQQKTYHDNSFENFVSSQHHQLQPFAFNPDTMQIKDWIRIGFSKKQATQITKYINIVGGLKNKEHFRKIYCVSEENFRMLEPYMHITVQQTAQNKPTAGKQQPFFQVELNTADSIALIAIRGIGAKTAHRIIVYRNILGGFYSLTQLLEVYTIDSNRFAQISPYLTVDKQYIVQINLNTASIQDLVKHPYIDYYLAKSIIGHRQKVGKYETVRDVKNATMLYEELYQKLLPYLSVQ